MHDSQEVVQYEVDDPIQGLHIVRERIIQAGFGIDANIERLFTSYSKMGIDLPENKSNTAKAYDLINSQSETLGDGGTENEEVENYNSVMKKINSERKRNLDKYWATKMDELLDEISEEERKVLDDNMQILSDSTDRFGFISKWEEDQWNAADQICSCIGRYYNFLDNDGSELRYKGTVLENFESFWKRQDNPDIDCGALRLDCKLPTIMLWHLLRKAGIRADVMVPPVDYRGLSLFAAHPIIRLRSDNEVLIESRTGQQIENQQRDKAMGICMQFIANEATPYHVSIERGSEYVNFTLPEACSYSPGALIQNMDKYYFIGALVHALRLQIDILSRVDSPSKYDDIKMMKWLKTHAFQEIVLELFPNKGAGYSEKENLRRFFNKLVDGKFPESRY